MSAVIPAGDTYTCAACGGVFEKGRSDDDAMLESKTLWGDLAPADLCVICDDCFERGKAAALTDYHAGMKSN